MNTIYKNQLLHMISTAGLQRNPNDYVLCGAILHELGAQQCHMRPKVECGVAGILLSRI